MLKDVKSVGIANKATLHVMNRVKHILQARQNVLISHI